MKKRREIVLLNRIERSAISTGAHSLAEVVDRERNAVRIVINGPRLLEPHLRPGEGFHPDNGLELDGLRGNGCAGTARVHFAIFRRSHHHAKVVDL